MITSTSRELVWLAACGGIALFIGGVIRQHLIGPQLSEAGEEPLALWLASLALPVALFVFAGWRADGLVRAVAFAGFAFFPWFIVSTIYSTMPTGTTSTAELGFWLAIPTEFGLWALVAVSGLVLRRVHRSVSAG